MQKRAHLQKYEHYKEGLTSSRTVGGRVVGEGVVGDGVGTNPTSLCVVLKRKS